MFYFKTVAKGLFTRKTNLVLNGKFWCLTAEFGVVDNLFAVQQKLGLILIFLYGIVQYDTNFPKQLVLNPK
jgi:hypothetical protein